jgi:hypothetical protein
VAGKFSCRGAAHGQTSLKDRTGAVAVRAALELALQLGRCDEVYRQADAANPSKFRDSLQANTVAHTSGLWPHLVRDPVPLLLDPF